MDEAIAQFQQTIETTPGSAEAHNELAIALIQGGRPDEAVAQLRKALEIRPEFVEAYNNLGLVFLRASRMDQAIASFQEAVAIQPNNAAANRSLGQLLFQKGLLREAVAHYEAVLSVEAADAPTLNNLAWLLATCPDPSIRNGVRAVELARQAEKILGDGNPSVLGTLAAAYAEAGRFGEAVATAKQALALVAGNTTRAEATALQAQLDLYQTGLPFRDHSQTKAPPAK